MSRPSGDGVRHEIWKIDEKALIDALTGGSMHDAGDLRADGHHRSAAGSRVGNARREGNPEHTGTKVTTISSA